MKRLLGAAFAALLAVWAGSAWAVTTNLCGSVTALGAATTHNFVTTLGTNCTFSIAQPAIGDLANIAGGTVLGNVTTSSGAVSATVTPVLGIAGTSNGTLGLSEINTGGVITLSPPTNTAVTSYTIQFPPAVAAVAGQALTSSTGGVTSWTTVPTAAFVISSQTGSTFTTTAAADGTRYDNTGNSGNTAGTLLATGSVTAGDNWCFLVTAAHTITITANTSETINYGGVVSASAGTMASSTVGASACGYFATATTFNIYSATGPWAVT